MITLQSVSKVYPTRRGQNKVLEDVSFTVRKGEHLGILGQNGSGKSTLIRLIAGAERPTTGTVTRNMSVSWPLAFGGAFQGSLSGVDNFNFICRVYGVNPSEKLPFLYEFSELGSYLREPLKTYSSGMFARLAFAISISIEFDCFLIDEIVAVGDANFREKCFHELFVKRNDRAMIMVSHNDDYIRRHCTKFAVMTGGRLIPVASIDEAHKYFAQGPVFGRFTE